MFWQAHTPLAANFSFFLTVALISGCGPTGGPAVPEVAPTGQNSAEIPVPDLDVPPTLESAMASIPAGGTDDERIRAILLHLQAKRDSITTYTMDIAWERYEFPETPLEAPLPKGTKVSYGEGTWAAQDGKWRVHRRKRWERPERPDHDLNAVRPAESDQGEYESWAIYNGDYFAFRHKDSAITLFPQAAIEAKVVIHEPELFPFPMEWGFSTGTQGSMLAYFDRAREFTEWKIEEIEAPDGPKIRIWFGSLEHGGTERVLDPLRDFLVVRVSSWDGDGKLTEKSLTLQQLEDGRWFPKHATHREKGKWRTYQFSNVRFNVPIEDRYFTLDSFEFDRHNTVLVQRKGRNFSSGQRMLFREGQWIPEPMVPAHERPTRKRPQ